MQNRPRVIGIIGAGTMGVQISLQFIAHGYIVNLTDHNPEILAKAKAFASYYFLKYYPQFNDSDEKENVLSNLNFFSDLKICVSNVDCVIEAINENLISKQDLFVLLDQICHPHVILASNSSSLKISSIGKNLLRQDKLVSMHFYNPVAHIPVVEIMGSKATNQQTIQIIQDMAISMKLTPIILNKESTGFIFNRIWHAVKKECLKIVDEGVSTPEEIDKTWRLISKMSVGPFALMDLVGLDVVRDIENIYYQESKIPSDLPPPFLEEMIEENRLGVKTGQGFYTYNQND